MRLDTKIASELLTINHRVTEICYFNGRGGRGVVECTGLSVACY